MWFTSIIACALAAEPVASLSLRNDSWGPWATRTDDGRTHQTTLGVRVGLFTFGIEHSILTQWWRRDYAWIDTSGPGPEIESGSRLDELTATAGWRVGAWEIGAGYRHRGDIGGEHMQNAVHRALEVEEWRGDYERVPGAAVAYGRFSWSRDRVALRLTAEATSDPTAAIDALVTLDARCGFWVGLRGHAVTGSQPSPVLRYVARRETTVAGLVGWACGPFAIGFEIERTGVLFTTVGIAITR